MGEVNLSREVGGACREHGAQAEDGCPDENVLGQAFA